MTRSSFEVAGVSPRRVATPASEAEAAEMLAACREAGEAAIVVGGGTMLEVGDPPTRYDVAVSTRELRGIVEYNPADLTVVVRAGTTLAELSAELGRHGQFLPLDAPLPDRATIGGVLSANASGTWRFAYGSGRDMVIGMRMALPSGQVAKSGGRVVKNVAGYDLAKLFIGAYGTLGAIVEVALKTYPSLARVHTLSLATGSLNEAIELARRLRDVGPGLLSAAVVGPSVISPSLLPDLDMPGPTIVVQVGGTDRAARALAAAVEAQGGRLVPGGEATAVQETLRDFPALATLKLSTTPSHTANALTAEDCQFVAYPLVGLCYLRDPDLRPADIVALRERLAPQGGSVTVQEAPLDLVRTAGTWGKAGPELALMRKVKRVFDLENVMSPGRYLGGL